MNRTIADSQVYDVVCMSFGKEQEKGIEVEAIGEKDSFLSETMEINVGTCSAADMNFTKGQMAQLMENRKARKTAKAISKTANQR